MLLLSNLTSTGKPDFNLEAQARSLGRSKHGAAGWNPDPEPPFATALGWGLADRNVVVLRRAGRSKHGEAARGGGKGDRTNADGRISRWCAVVVWSHGYELLMNRGKAGELPCTRAAALHGKN
jgi:hypothetical protein